jgi:hypothetical protein
VVANVRKRDGGAVDEIDEKLVLLGFLNDTVYHNVDHGSASGEELANSCQSSETKIPASISAGPVCGKRGSFPVVASA